MWGFELFVKVCQNFNRNPCVFSFNSLVYMWTVTVGLYGTSWPNEKLYRPEIWFTHSPRPNLKMGFMVFSKKRSRGPLASKNCRVTWIFRISPRSPSCSVFWKIVKKWGFSFLLFLMISLLQLSRQLQGKNLKKYSVPENN